MTRIYKIARCRVPQLLKALLWLLLASDRALGNMWPCHPSSSSSKLGLPIRGQHPGDFARGSIYLKHLLPLLPTPLDSQYHSLLQEVFLDPTVWPVPLLGSHSFCALQNCTEHSFFLVQYHNVVHSGSRQVFSCMQLPFCTHSFLRFGDLFPSLLSTPVCAPGLST